MVPLFLPAAQAKYAITFCADSAENGSFRKPEARLYTEAIAPLLRDIAQLPALVRAINSSV